MFFETVNYGLKKSNKDAYGIINYIIQNKEDNKICIIGNSRAMNDLNPLVFEQEIGVATFNSGNYKNQITEVKLLLDRYLYSNHSKPKAILFVIDGNVLNADLEISFPPRYFPYYDDSLIYNEIAKVNPEIRAIKKCPAIAITQYTDYMRQLGMISAISPQCWLENKGFLPLQTGEFHEGKKTSGLDSKVMFDVSGLKKMMDLCKTMQKLGIKLYLIAPPTFQKNDLDLMKCPFGEALKQFIKKYLKDYNVDLLDYTHIDLCLKKKYFYDTYHLNAKGAEVFSKLVVQDIKLK